MTKDQAIKMLSEIKNIAKDASIIGEFQDSVVVLIPMYQKIRNAAIKNEWADEELIIDLNEEDEKIFNKDVEQTDVVGAAAGLFLKLLED